MSYAVDSIFVILIIWFVIGSSNALVSYIYFYFTLIFIEYSFKGRSIGKYIFRIKLMSNRGTPPSFYQVSLRMLILTSPPLISYIFDNLLYQGLAVGHAYENIINALVAFLAIAIWSSFLVGRGNIAIHDYVANTCIVPEDIKSIDVTFSLRRLSYLAIFILVIYKGFSYILGPLGELTLESNVADKLRMDINKRWVNSKKMSQTINNANKYLDYKKGIQTWVLNIDEAGRAMSSKGPYLGINLYDNANNKDINDSTYSIRKYMIHMKTIPTNYIFQRGVAEYISNNYETDNKDYILVFKYEYYSPIGRASYMKSQYVYNKGSIPFLFDDFEGTSQFSVDSDLGSSPLGKSHIMKYILN